MGRIFYILFVLISLNSLSQSKTETKKNEIHTDIQVKSLASEINNPTNESNILKAKHFKEKGDIAVRQGDIDYAHECWEKSNIYRSKAYPLGDYHLVWNTAQLTIYHHLNKNYAKSIALADETVELISGLTVEQQNEIEIYKIWNILGQTYKQAKKDLSFTETQKLYERVTAYYLNSVQFIQEHKIDDTELAGTYRLLGNSYTDLIFRALQNDKEIALDYYNKATNYYDKSIAIAKLLLDDEHYQLSKNYFVQGLLNYYVKDQLDINSSERSIHYYELAVEAYGIDINKPLKKDLEPIVSKNTFLMLLKHLTLAYLVEFKKDQSLTWLEKAEKVNQIAIDAWSAIHNQYMSNNINQTLSVYELVPFIETISIELFKQKSKLNYDINVIFKANQKLKYYDLLKLDKNNKSLVSDISIHQLQEKLKENEVFLDFHISEEAKRVIALRFTSTTAELITLPYLKREIFEETIEGFLNAIKTFDFNSYTSSAHTIYESWMKPCKIDDSDLILCLDGVLNNLPFEALLTSKNNWDKKDYRELDYLIKKNQVQYVLNPQMFRDKQSDTKSKKQFNLQAFIPENVNFSSLPFSLKLGENLERNSKAQLFASDKATKSSFIKLNSSIVHLSGHGVISDQNVMDNHLVFSDSLLYLNELMNIENIPSLVILNTCNSAIGRIYSGDGINGFVRMLSRMGAESVMSNLWEVDDQASNALLHDFYEELIKGTVTTHSLTKAQLELIQNANSSKSAAPYYWAAHRLVGNELSFNKIETNQSSSSTRLWLISASVLLISLGVLGKYFYRKSKKSTAHRF
ncbi:CHAT domain-containing protein [Brumimicrobium glaciale]|uniref:CHAT domain-containing protein n=1 Tax=Brumimicrobium glaciale TaxID=200475 RepID=A0A4Q4KI00_9FLAO|nr:CHAT domain-containing protein [Brumimicrobium glaciale]RYM32851.1 CHAT domain-containing protein [Brumimicrobium glaciale]